MSENKIAVSVSEAADMLSVSRPTIYRLLHSEGFPASFKVGGRTLISVDALREWVRSQAGGVPFAEGQSAG